jgi:uridine kinase
VASEDRPYLIGVAGGSNSGKTTIAERMAEVIGSDELTLIRLDSYYVAMHDEPIEVRAAFNYDHPDAFDWDLLKLHLERLTAGETVAVPIYDFTIYDRTDRVELVRPGKVVVVEGILVLWEPRLRGMLDLKVFVDTPADLRIIRRLRRDVAERGRTPESILEQYLTTVRPSHEQFIEPSKRYADVIVPEGGLNRPALDVLLARVRELTSTA